MSRPKRERKQEPKGLKSIGKTSSPEAKKLAAVVLEVLGGVRTTTDAAEALECSLPRYYHLEARALEGLLVACEPRKKGRVWSPNRELELLHKKCERLEREVGRQQALVRAAHRTVGLTPSTPSKPVAGKKRPRRPTTRALVAAETLKENPSDEPSTPPSSGSP
jgi:hypothetical protein